MRNGKNPHIKTIVIQCLIQKFEDSKTIEILDNHGYRVSQRTLGRIKRRLKEGEFSELSDIAKQGFMSQHLERIKQLELIIKEMWLNYNNEENPSKKVIILQTIAQVRPYLSQYYEATAEIAKEYCHKPTT
jgi:hypothetical protein